MRWFEAADWFPANDPEVRAVVRSRIESAYARAQGIGTMMGPLKVYELAPGDDRCPPPPVGMNEPRLLVGDADVFEPPVSNMTADLEPEDLSRLRTVTRRAHARTNPARPLTDAECDAIINRLGPQAAVKTLH